MHVDTLCIFKGACFASYIQLAMLEFLAGIRSFCSTVFQEAIDKKNNVNKIMKWFAVKGSLTLTPV